MDNFAAAEEAAAKPRDEIAHDGAAEVADDEKTVGREAGFHGGEGLGDLMRGEVMEEEAVGEEVKLLRREIVGNLAQGARGGDVVGFCAGDGLIDGGLALVQEGECDGDAFGAEVLGDADGDIPPAARNIQEVEMRIADAPGVGEQGFRDGGDDARGLVDAAKASEGAAMLEGVDVGGVHEFGEAAAVL